MNAEDAANMLEDAGLFEQFCGTWVRGLQSEEVARVLGADPSSATTRTMRELNAERWRVPDDQPILLIGPASDTHVLVVEPQSYLGMRLDALRSLSSGGGQVINIYWTINLNSRLTLAQDGEIVTAFSLTAPDINRKGRQPSYLEKHLKTAGLATGQDFDDRVGVALALAGQLTGTLLTNEWFNTPQRKYVVDRGRR